jgi:hypothetical protein
MKTFKEYLEEASNLGSGELGKPNSMTGEKRVDILRKLITTNTPIETIDGKHIIIGDIQQALDSIDQFEKDGKSFTMISNQGEKVSLTKIKKSKVFGGGGSGAGGGTIQTAIAESAQCLWIMALLHEGLHDINYFTDDILKQYSKHIDVGKTKIDQMLQIDDSWKKSSYDIAKFLIQNGFVNKNMKLHRDSKIMNAIYKKKNEAFKNNGFRPMSNDKWNPGDIWAVSNDFNLSEIDTSNIQSLRTSILKHYTERRLIGISLKKVEKTLKYKELNLEIPPDVDLHKLKEIQMSSKKGSFWSAKGATVVYDTGTIDIRDNSSFGTIKTEIRGKTARGGGAGWGPMQDAALKTFRTKLPSTQEIAKKAKAIEKGSKKDIDLFYELMISSGVNMDKKEVIKTLAQKPAPWIHAKLGVMHITSLINQGGRKANDFITKIINYAGSTTEESSVYLKIFE